MNWTKSEAEDKQFTHLIKSTFCIQLSSKPFIHIQITSNSTQIHQFPIPNGLHASFGRILRH